MLFCNGIYIATPFDRIAVMEMSLDIRFTYSRLPFMWPNDQKQPCVFTQELHLFVSFKFLLWFRNTTRRHDTDFYALCARLNWYFDHLITFFRAPRCLPSMHITSADVKPFKPIYWTIWKSGYACKNFSFCHFDISCWCCLKQIDALGRSVMPEMNVKTVSGV